MGTRSLTTFIRQWKDEETNEVKQDEIVTMYRQFDGYPIGMGIDLAEFLCSGKMVNGIPIGNAEKERLFNGMGCLSAQAVAYFKDGPGGIYLYRGGTKDCWEEYRYEVIFDEDTRKLTMRCYDVYENNWIFDGEPKEFTEFAEASRK